MSTIHALGTILSGLDFGIPTELLEQIVRERHCILYDVKMYGYCSGETLVLDAETWAGNEDVIQRIEEERNQ